MVCSFLISSFTGRTQRRLPDNVQVRVSQRSVNLACVFLVREESYPPSCNKSHSKQEVNSSCGCLNVVGTGGSYTAPLTRSLVEAEAGNRKRLSTAARR